MLKVGLLGTGHLGKIHLRLLREIPDIQLVGFFDPNPETAGFVQREFGVQSYASEAALVAASDALDIVTPTIAHHACAKRALLAGKHVFIEKPLTRTLQEAEELMALVARTGLVAQVGHVERFNPAFLAVAEMQLRPMFIEGHRLAQWNPRGTDVSVVLDLMIHDIDVVLSMVKAPIERISASGVAVVSDSPDIANARLEFANGCVANLTASRISIKNMRRLRIFEPNCYLTVDFLDKQAELFRIAPPDAPALGVPGQLKFKFEAGPSTKYLIYEKAQVEQVNAIKMELEEFAASILRQAPIRVPIQDGYRALQTASEIIAKIAETAAKAGMGSPGQ